MMAARLSETNRLRRERHVFVLFYNEMLRTMDASLNAGKPYIDH